MTPPRWNSPYASRVREDLVRMIDDGVDASPAAARTRSTNPRFAFARHGGVRNAVVTVVVLALLVVAGGVVLRLAGPGSPAGPGTAAPTPSTSPSPSPSPRPSAGTVAALPAVHGTLLTTWTNDDTLPSSRTLNAHGQAIAITLACTGGGRVAYTQVGSSDSATGCSGTFVSGPSEEIKGGALIARHTVVVRVSTTGHPRFALQVWAVPVRKVPLHTGEPTIAPTGAGVPASLRTCTSGDLAPTASYRRWPHFQGGLVTIRSAAGTDCAIRSRPKMVYLDSQGKVIGGPASTLSDDAVGPVRLAAHGTAWVQIELFAMTSVTDCGARQVRSLRLTIGDATTTIPIPSVPAVGKCVDPHYVADGVGNVERYEPTGP